MSTIVLAYSGGLDTSVLLKRLLLEGNDVIALTADLGESDAATGDAAAAAIGAISAKARALGARDAVALDVRERFFHEYVLPAFAANVRYEGCYPLSAALSRPLIAALLVETARAYGADAVAHGCTGKGNDQVRIELGVRALDPNLTVRAPLRESPLSRPDAITFAAEHGIPIAQSAAKPYSIDANLWGRSIEAGVLEDPWVAPPEDAFGWTASPQDRPSTAEEIVVLFREGVPLVAGISGAPLLARLNALGGMHGIGRIDLIEDRVIGLKSRELYEAPAATILLAAREALERLVLTRDELRFKAGVDRKYGELVYDGLWHSPLRAAFDAFNAVSSVRLSGEVRVRLYQGSATVVGVRSPFALYDEGLATYGAGDRFDHHAADGFIHLAGLPLDRLAQVAAVTAG
ncbi:MAG: argininosuccinate synthase [Candidatus Eremiobacteraeota bacterium]|nr:argininosuccinate synthase [Candidatus Eremiobacteraeota bacterium]NNM91742.1 argininosuccinate synthase [Candidatus Eremiobacteraeota bacterium]